jgi:hypothetical protein
LIATIATVVLRLPVAVDRTSGALTVRRRPARSAESESAARQEAALAVPGGAALMPGPAVAPASNAPSEPG